MALHYINGKIGLYRWRKRFTAR